MVGHFGLAFSTAGQGDFLIFQLELLRTKNLQSVLSLAADWVLYLNDLRYLIPDGSLEANIHAVGVVEQHANEVHHCQHHFLSAQAVHVSLCEELAETVLS